MVPQLDFDEVKIAVQSACGVQQQDQTALRDSKSSSFVYSKTSAPLVLQIVQQGQLVQL